MSVRTPSGDCPLHVKRSAFNCSHCARAKAATEAALADVVPIPAGQRTAKRRTSTEDVATVRRLHAEGASAYAIARDTGIRKDTVRAIIAGRAHAPDMLHVKSANGKRLAHQLAMGPKGAKKQARETHVPLRDGVMG